MSENIRELSNEEVGSLYLPLRKRIFEELGWSRHANPNPASLRDAYDAEAIHLGFFVNEEFAGALRLIISAHPDRLPSGPFMPAGRAFSGSVAEISKSMVERRFRGNRVYTRMIQATIERAARKGIVHLFIGGMDSPEVRGFYPRFGFVVVNHSYQFADEHVALGSTAVLFHKQIL